MEKVWNRFRWKLNIFLVMESLSAIWVTTKVELLFRLRILLIFSRITSCIVRDCTLKSKWRCGIYFSFGCTSLGDNVNVHASHKKSICTWYSPFGSMVTLHGHSTERVQILWIEKKGRRRQLRRWKFAILFLYTIHNLFAYYHYTLHTIALLVSISNNIYNVRTPVNENYSSFHQSPRSLCIVDNNNLSPAINRICLTKVSLLIFAAWGITQVWCKKNDISDNIIWIQCSVILDVSPFKNLSRIYCSSALHYSRWLLMFNWNVKVAKTVSYLVEFLIPRHLKCTSEDYPPFRHNS